MLECSLLKASIEIVLRAEYAKMKQSSALFSEQETICGTWSLVAEEGGEKVTTHMQVARLAENNAALQDEVERLRTALDPKEDELATLHAVNARLAEENAELSAAVEAAERRMTDAASSAADQHTSAALAAAEVNSQKP